MERLWDVCWVCEGVGATANGDCENCKGTGIINEDEK